MTYKNYLIRRVGRKWQAVDREDGWDTDWLDIFEYDDLNALKQRLDELE